MTQEDTRQAGPTTHSHGLPGTERVGCPDCGLVQALVPPGRGEIAECPRCSRILAGTATGRIGTPLALFVSALVLLIPAIAAPLLVVYTFGARRAGWLSTNVTALWRDGFESLGALVGLFSIVLPAVFLLLIIWVLASLRWQRTAPVGAVFRWAQHLRPWVMIEVFLVGGFVAYSRIKVVSSVDVGIGGWCLLAAALLVMLAVTQLDERTVWEKLRPQETTPDGGSTIACTVCDFIVPAAAAGGECPRCGAGVYRRKPDSLRRTAALAATGYLLYIPANTLPVLTTVRFGREETNTILSGVIELARNDLWPLAVIVFTASIILPLVKLAGLTWMLLATRRGSGRLLVARTRLYRSIDTVGRWSNIDIFSVAVLVAILQFGSLTAVHAGDGLVAFGAVVIVTMFATLMFDPRLMWDAGRSVHG
ncbi:MAG TPA: paraquat-inducible protein A [Steroidobacteraceae bacterium]|nr:paraquat-inducible protein A [Steroidobacteraceae bacterium]